jgi:hypothetical protein
LHAGLDKTRIKGACESFYDTLNGSIGDAYAVATASDIDNDSDRDVILLVGADDDYDVFEDETGFEHLIERFRDESA